MAWNSTIKQKFGYCTGILCKDNKHPVEVPLAHVKKVLCQKCNNWEKNEERKEKQRNTGVSGQSNTQKKVKKSYSIPKFSKKRIKELAEYRIKRDKYMKDNLICEFKGCKRLGNDLHHKAKRGKNLCDETTFMSVCRNHHNWIHEHPIESKELGYLIIRK